MNDEPVLRCPNCGIVYMLITLEQDREDDARFPNFCPTCGGRDVLVWDEPKPTPRKLELVP